MTDWWMWKPPEGLRGRVDWDADFKMHPTVINCRKNPGHSRAGPRVPVGRWTFNQHTKWDRGLVWAHGGDCLATDRVREVFMDEKVTGVEFRKTHVRWQPERPKEIPPFWELRVTGFGGWPANAAGTSYIETCPDCGIILFVKTRQPSLAKIVDKAEWDGSDMFYLWPDLHGVREFATPRVREIVQRHKIGPVKLLPAEECYVSLEYGDIDHASTPEVLFTDETAAKVRGMAKARGVIIPPAKFRHDEVG